MWQRRTIPTTGLLAVLLLLGPAAAGLAAEPCDPGLEDPAGDALGYRLRGDRCEGRYVRLVGAGTLRLASLTVAFEDFDRLSSDQILVEWTPPAAGNVPQSSVRLRAHGLKRRLYYRMDKVSAPGDRAYRWPAKVLRDLRLGSRDFGVFGRARYRLGETDQDVYIPLRVRQAGSPEPAHEPRAVLFPDQELAEVYVSLARLGTDGRPRDFLRDRAPLRHGYYPAFQGVEVTLDELEASGFYLLEIGATLRSGGSIALEATLYYPGSRG